MRCERCDGLTINAYFSGGLTVIEAWEYDGRKCLNCGYITDPLILRNKVAQYQRSDRRKSTLGSSRGTRTGGKIAAEQARQKAGDLASQQF
jgi:hypothetical protein